MEVKRKASAAAVGGKSRSGWYERIEPEPLDWSIVVTDAAGESATLPLGHDRLLYPQIQAPTRRASFLEFTATSEVVFDRFEIGLGDFVHANPAFDPAAIREIRFVFDANPTGVVVIDDVGFAGVVH